MSGVTQAQGGRGAAFRLPGGPNQLQPPPSAPQPSISSDYSYLKPHLPPPGLWAPWVEGPHLEPPCSSAPSPAPAERLSSIHICSRCVLKCNLPSGSFFLLQTAFKKWESSFHKENATQHAFGISSISCTLSGKKKKILGIYFSRNAQTSHK